MPEDSDSTRPRLPGAVPGDDSATWLSIDVAPNAGDWSAFTPAEDWVLAAALALAANERFAAYGQSEACVVLSDDTHVRGLNATYRDIDKPTNVLSFPSGQGPRHGVIALGDIVLAGETVAREAAEQGIEPRQHLQHLVVHGLLHLLGFDHETDAEAAEMESLEIAVLATLDIPNPYAETAET